MTKRVAVATVPHSGTNLMRSILKRAGYRTVSTTDDAPGCDKVAHVAHVLKDTQIRHIERLARDWPVICPIRHPYRVAESWRRMDWPWSEDDLVGAYRSIVNRIIVPHGASVLPIDSPRRDYFLGRLEGRLGEDLYTDWSIVSPKASTYDIRMEDLMHTEKTEALVKELSGFFGEYYQ